MHWRWLPWFTPEDFRLRSIAGDVPGTTLADWPISYDELEPYYDKIEWAFGGLGRPGPTRTRVAQPRYPCPPMPQSRYAEKFHKVCGTGLELFPHAAGRAVPRSTAVPPPS